MIALLFQEGQWVWESNEAPFTYKRWSKGHPKDDYSENCLELYTGVSGGISKPWINVKCERSRHFKPL